MHQRPENEIEVAWFVYERLEELTSLLWSTYEKEFLATAEFEMCQPEPPWDPPDDLDEDDIPF